jgi:P27 family predicted phage terminase small subunit
MGKRGPQPDAAQEAKGYPGRRRSKADKAAIEAARVAQLIAPLTADQVGDVPAMLQDPKYAAAAAIYRKLAPELRRTHRLPAESETLFTAFCIYWQEWITATEDLHIKGFSQDIKTVAGGKMERRRPMTLDRQQAWANCVDLSGRFGLTPSDMYGLFKGQAAVAPTNPGLFGEDRKPTEPDPQPGRVGALGRMRSTPPAERPN